MLLFTFQDFIWALLVGLLASAIVAVVVELAKKRKERYHIRLRKLHSRIFFAQKSGDVEIRVSYKSHEVHSSLLVLYVILENDGKQDIRFNTHFSSGVYIRNPKYRFIFAETNSSEVNASCEYNEDSVLVQWDILKVGESIKLELVVESKEDNGKSIISDAQFINNLQYDFRSDCIDKICLEEDKKPLMIRFARSPYFGFLFCVAVLSLYLFLALSNNVQYSFESSATDNNVFHASTVLYSPVFDKCILLGKDSRIIVVKPDEMPITMTLQFVPRSSFEYITSIIIEMMVYIMGFLLFGSIITGIIVQRKRKKNSY